MQSLTFILASLAALGQAAPVNGRDDIWQVTDFAGESHHMHTHQKQGESRTNPLIKHTKQHTPAYKFCILTPENSVSLQVQIGSADPVNCGGVGNGVLSSAPTFLPISGKCGEDDSGLTFNFSQIENFAIKLDVTQKLSNVTEAVTRTYTSDTGVVQYVSTGDSPLDTSTSYTGPQDFTLQS
ncbi:hypothetical protein G7054_g5568 [Neopestalotiopsis clavispora]|nr:hypothetical protein G7054_g5568 [Neopestalotiopsis clavispora]